VALILRRRGIERVRPLAGGFRAWRDLGYPMTGLARTEPEPAAGVLAAEKSTSANGELGRVDVA
jgi:3-mercaptopyruvate sulfurtransferase SseA